VLELICYLAAVILFGLTAFNVAARLNLLALGLALFTLPWLVHAMQAVG
jgi:hypothetical protein